MMSLMEMGKASSLSVELGVNLEEIARKHMLGVHGSETGRTQESELVDTPVTLNELSEHIMYLVRRAGDGEELSFPEQEGDLGPERLG